MKSAASWMKASLTTTNFMFQRSYNLLQNVCQGYTELDELKDTEAKW